MARHVSSYVLAVALSISTLTLTSFNHVQAAVDPRVVNVTWDPKRLVSRRVAARNARLRNQTHNAPARGHIRTLMARVTVRSWSTCVNVCKHPQLVCVLCQSARVNKPPTTRLYSVSTSDLRCILCRRRICAVGSYDPLLV